MAARPALQSGQHSRAIVGVEPVDPQVRGGLDLLEREAGQLRKIAAHEFWRAGRCIYRLEVKDDRKRLDDRRLSLLR